MKSRQNRDPGDVVDTKNLPRASCQTVRRLFSHLFISLNRGSFHARILRNVCLTFVNVISPRDLRRIRSRRPEATRRYLVIPRAPRLHI